MAGNYPDVPSWRIPYDLDGTVMFMTAENSDTSFSQDDALAAQLNDEDMASSNFSHSNYNYRTMMWMFPRKMNLHGYWIVVRDYGYVGMPNLYRNILWSPNTTNGVDGTWTTVVTGSTYSRTSDGFPPLRNNIQGLSITGARALKFKSGSGHNGFATFYSAFHLYGEPTAGEDTNKLQIVKPGTDERIAPAHFDFGDVPRNSTNIKQFRIKNRSTTATANDISVSLEVPTDTTPSFGSMHKFSDGGSYLGQINIGNLAPGGISGNIDIRQIIDSNAVLGLRWGRIRAQATSWS